MKISRQNDIIDTYRNRLIRPFCHSVQIFSLSGDVELIEHKRVIERDLFEKIEAAG